MEKTILYIGGMELPDRNAAAQRVISNCKILSDTGYKVILVGFDRLFEKNKLRKIAIKRCEAFTRPYPKSVFQWLNYITRIKVIKKVLKQYENQIDMIIAYNYPAVSLIRLAKYAKKNDIKMIADCTEWYGKTKNIIKNIDTSLRMKYVHKKINNIICVSDYLEKYYSNCDCKVVSIPTLVDGTDKKWKLNKGYIPSLTRTFSYVGSPGKSKEKDQLSLIVKAFYQLKLKGYSFKLNIVGITKKHFLDIYENVKIMEQLTNEVCFFGQLSHLECIEILKNSDYSIFARLDNRVTMAGFPTKLGESFACSVPVVTNPTSNISKFLSNGINGYIARDCSLQALADAIESAIIVNDDTLVKMHHNCAKNNPLDYKNFSKVFIDYINEVSIIKSNYEII